MPGEIKERLRAFVPAPQPARLATLEALPAQAPGTDAPITIVETELVALRELRAVLRLVDAGKVEVTESTRRATATALRALGAVLAAPTMAIRRTRSAPSPGRSWCRPPAWSACAGGASS